VLITTGHYGESLGNNIYDCSNAFAELIADKRYRYCFICLFFFIEIIYFLIFKE